MAQPGNPYHDPQTGKFTTGGGTPQAGPHPDAISHAENGTVRLVQTPGKRNVRYQVWDGETLIQEVPASAKWRTELKEMTARVQNYHKEATEAGTSQMNQAIRKARGDTSASFNAMSDIPGQRTRVFQEHRDAELKSLEKDRAALIQIGSNHVSLSLFADPPLVIARIGDRSIFENLPLPQARERMLELADEARRMHESQIDTLLPFVHAYPTVNRRGEMGGRDSFPTGVPSLSDAEREERIRHHQRAVLNDNEPPILRTEEDIQQRYPFQPQSLHQMGESIQNQRPSVLSQDEVEAIEAYRNHDSWSINGYLRGTIRSHTSDDEVNAALLETVIDGTPPLDTPTTVFRGVKVTEGFPIGSSASKEAMDNHAIQSIPAVGSIIRDKGFTSTTLDPGMAAEFAHEESIPGEGGFLGTDDSYRVPGYVSVIRLPPGTQAMTTRLVDDRQRNELELLLQRGGRFQVTAQAEATDGTIYVYMDYLGSER